MALIKARQQSLGDKMDGFFSSLEEKYCTKKPKAAEGERVAATRREKESGARKGQSNIQQLHNRIGILFPFCTPLLYFSFVPP